MYDFYDGDVTKIIIKKQGMTGFELSELLYKNGIEDETALISEEDEKWHPGVLGIVASRIKDKYQRPTLLFHYDEEKEALEVM